MTFEEIVEFYRADPKTANREVTKRSTVSNLDQTLIRGGTCLCGYCGDDKVCACGLDRVMHGRDCVTCGRPWWCER